MITRRGTLKCDFCGQFVSWKDVELGAAQCLYYEWCEETLGGPEMHDDVAGACYKCTEKGRMV